MSINKTITVFGANGQVGSLFSKLVLEAGYSLRAFVRNGNFPYVDNPLVEVIEGDVMNTSDVARAVNGVDFVASFLGNPHPNPRNIFIMEAAADHILTAAAAQPESPRCLMISSVGCGGSSWLIKLMLQMINSRKGFADYERADDRIRNEPNVTFALIRPYALTDNPGTGKYKVIPGRTAHFAKSISRSDVALFFYDCLTDSQWDGAPGVNIGGS